jgi:hypothetical protein
LAWAVKVTEEYATWFTALVKEDLRSATQVGQAVAALREEGPTLGRPLVDRLKGSNIHHLKGASAWVSGPLRDQDHLCVRPEPLGVTPARRRQGWQLAALVSRQHPAR